MLKFTLVIFKRDPRGNKTAVRLLPHLSVLASSRVKLYRVTSLSVMNVCIARKALEMRGYPTSETILPTLHVCDPALYQGMVTLVVK